MAAPIGNKFGTKLKDPDIRQQAYRKYCEWVASGMPKKAFTFKHPEFTCTYRTLDKYMADNPEEFPPLTMEVAQSESYAVWFNKGVHMMEGGIEKCQPAIYQMIMRNIHKWDTEHNEQKETKATLVEKFLDRLDKMDDKNSSTD